MSKYRGEIGALQDRQLPPNQSQLKIGMLSHQGMLKPQTGQCERRGESMPSPSRGIRKMQTLRKLPAAAPKKNAQGLYQICSRDTGGHPQLAADFPACFHRPPQSPRTAKLRRLHRNCKSLLRTHPKYLTPTRCSWFVYRTRYNLLRRAQHGERAKRGELRIVRK